MKISITLAIIIAFMIFGGALLAFNGYLQQDKNQIFVGGAGFAAGILFTLRGSFQKETQKESKDESLPGGGYEC